jgi:hypothetical protein
MRWSSGRFAIAGRYGLGLLYRGIVEGNFVKFDAALPLLFPNPSLAMNLSLLGLVSGWIAGAPRVSNLSLWFVSLVVCQMAIFILGVSYTQNKIKKLMAIFVAPAFLVWKMGIDALSLFGFGRRKWVRTERRL